MRTAASRRTRARAGSPRARMTSGDVPGDPAPAMRLRSAPVYGASNQMRLLVTGGAGFVGGNVCVCSRRGTRWEVVAFDNLHRRGSELNLPRLRDGWRRIRARRRARRRRTCSASARSTRSIECSAEPSVLAGGPAASTTLVRTNLVGAYNCLELCRRDDAQLVFLSTSRVYPMAALVPSPTRRPARDSSSPTTRRCQGVSSAGIARDVSAGGARTLYGATKLAAELLIAEYASAFALPRRRSIAAASSPGRGRWARSTRASSPTGCSRTTSARPLTYIGYGGSGQAGARRPPRRRPRRS